MIGSKILLLAIPFVVSAVPAKERRTSIAAVGWQQIAATGCCTSTYNTPIVISQIPDSTVNSCKAACGSVTQCGAFNQLAAPNNQGGWTRGVCQLLLLHPAVDGADTNPNCRCFKKRPLPPQPSPTQSPMTSSPTTSPTTSSPTTSPTTSSPTTSPTTSAPTVSPAASPTVSPTTSAPTLSPTTSAPTLTPTTSAPTLSPTTSAPTQGQAPPPPPPWNGGFQLIGNPGCCTSAYGTTLTSGVFAPGADTQKKCRNACSADPACGSYNMRQQRRPNGRWARGVCELLPWYPWATGHDSNPNCRCYRKRI